MRHSFRFLLLFASMAAMDALSSHAAINVSGLRCESAVNPLGIDAAKPRLSWLLTSSKRGQKQTAYQILAASDENKLQSDQADIWDSVSDPAPLTALEYYISLEDQSNQRQTSPPRRIDCHLALPVLSRQVSKNGQISRGMSLACPYLSRAPRRGAGAQRRSQAGVGR
jgi:hypothetical protein